MSINLDNVTNIMLGNTPVEQIADSLGNVLWSGTVDPATQYFYVEDISGSDNTLSITKNDFFAPDVEVFYSTDQQNWVSMGTTTRETPITATIPANGKLYLKATADTWGDGGMFAYNYINASGAYNVGGNIMSLLYGDNYTNQTSFPTGSAYNFFGLFSDMNDTNHLISAEYLILPATTLTDSCYISMFQNCTSLTTAPVLPTTTLANNCYQGMFQNCTSLTTAPVLPATTLADSCYSDMFSYCTSLTTAPVLPATTLADSCYSDMFGECSLLTTAPVLPATTLTTGCYSSMFSGCTSLTTAPELPVTTLATGCYEGMFQNCTSLTTAPVLPATTLTDYCYMLMFYGCSSLNTVTTYANDISANNCLSDWVNGVAASGDFYNLGSATYPSGTSGIPSGWTEHTSL